MSYGRMVKEERRLQAEIGALLKRAEAVDEAEDARYGRGRSRRRAAGGAQAARGSPAGGDPGGEGAPGGRAESDGRRAGPQARASRASCSKGGKPFKREYGEPDAKAQSNFTDPTRSVLLD